MNARKTSELFAVACSALLLLWGCAGEDTGAASGNEGEPQTADAGTTTDKDAAALEGEGQATEGEPAEGEGVPAEGEGIATEGEGQPTEGEGEWNAPNPGAGPVDTNWLDEPPVALIISPDGLQDAWQVLADWRTARGVPTLVVPLSEALALGAGPDDAAKLLAYLRLRHGEGRLKYVLLGGDAELLPYRRVFSAYNSPLGDSFTANGPCDSYFADMDRNWDQNGNGEYGEQGGDITMADLRALEIGVGRLAASNEDDVNVFVDKIMRYETDSAPRANYPLLLSDVASTVGTIEIDAAEAIEATLQAVFPADFRTNAKKLYAVAATASRYGGQVGTPQNIKAALEDPGYALVFHEGHGAHGNIAVTMDTDLVQGLANAVPPVFASCACLSGNFADVADGGDAALWSEQGAGEDSAGEWLMQSELGGAAAYLGSTGIGLGPVGGAQFLHAFFDAAFNQGLFRLGDAVNYAHANFRAVNIRVSIISMPVDDSSEWYTHRVAILHGDPTMPLWTGAAREPQIAAPASFGPGYNDLAVGVAAGGLPVAGATVTLAKEGDFLLLGETDAAGEARFRFWPARRRAITITASGLNLLARQAVLQPSP